MIIIIIKKVSHTASLHLRSHDASKSNTATAINPAQCENNNHNNKQKNKTKTLTLVTIGWSGFRLTLILAVSQDNLSLFGCPSAWNSIPSEWPLPAPHLPSLFHRTGAVLSVRPLLSFLRGRSSRPICTSFSNLGGFAILGRKRLDVGWGWWQGGHRPHLSSSTGFWDPSPLRGKTEHSLRTRTSDSWSSKA